MQPLVSIVIPTRNRQSYCIAAIQNILSYEFRDFELCVHDNSDDNQVGQFISTYIRDDRLRYVYVPNPLNSVINMDKSVAMACGKYVCMIGDDDTVMPEFFDIVQWMDVNQIQSGSSRRFINYYWPHAYRNEPNGILFIPPFSGRREGPIDVWKNVVRLFRHGIVSYSKYGLPRLYHGIILRECLEKVRQKTGHYYGGLSPDIYSAVALSGVIQSHYLIDMPLTIAGACKMSSTSESTRNQHCGDLFSAPHFRLRGPYQWDQMIPAYFSGSTLWAESALKAVDEMGLKGLREKFNFYRFAAFVLIDDRAISSMVRQKLWEAKHPALRNHPVALIRIASAFCEFAIIKLWSRFTSFFRKKTIRVDQISNIDEAVQAVMTRTKFK